MCLYADVLLCQSNKYDMTWYDMAFDGSKYCTAEANYWQTRSIERPLCNRRTRPTCLALGLRLLYNENRQPRRRILNIQKAEQAWNRTVFRTSCNNYQETDEPSAAYVTAACSQIFIVHEMWSVAVTSRRQSIRPAVDRVTATGDRERRPSVCPL